MVHRLINVSHFLAGLIIVLCLVRMVGKQAQLACRSRTLQARLQAFKI
jgi:hypothetical protein